MKIGILGGTFDPIHCGHLTLARAARDQFQLSQVLFIPALNPPHKIDQRTITPASHRCRMIDIALSEEPDFEISRVEIDRSDISYTIETLRLLQKQYSGHSLFLILGVDSLNEIPTWREPQEIRNIVQLLVAHRPGEVAKEKSGDGLSWIQMSLCSFSSSEIRERIRKGQDVDSMLPQGVDDYIRKNKLYQA